MAQKLVLIDDLTDTSPTQTYTFTLDNEVYEMDLSAGSYTMFQAALRRSRLEKADSRKAAEAATATEAPKRRGRPKGSTNKKKVAEAKFSDVPKRKPGRPRKTVLSDGYANDAAAIRAWARSKKMKVTERGRVPAELREAWEKAGSPIV